MIVRRRPAMSDLLTARFRRARSTTISPEPTSTPRLNHRTNETTCGFDRRGCHYPTSAQGSERLRGAEDAQDIAARQRLKVGFGPAPVQQFDEQGGVLGDVVQAGRDFRGAVEVAADANVVDARYLAHVLHV